MMNRLQKQVVIIEDDAILRRGLRRVFCKEHFVVFDFEDGKRAFEQINLSTPDLILCDYKLPGINGIEILKKFRKNNNETPFFLITGYLKEEILAVALENGANQVFEKPLDLQFFKKYCRRALLSSL